MHVGILFKVNITLSKFRKITSIDPFNFRGYSFTETHPFCLVIFKLWKKSFDDHKWHLDRSHALKLNSDHPRVQIDYLIKFCQNYQSFDQIFTDSKTTSWTATLTPICDSRLIVLKCQIFCRIDASCKFKCQFLFNKFIYEKNSAMFSNLKEVKKIRENNRQKSK